MQRNSQGVSITEIILIIAILALIGLIAFPAVFKSTLGGVDVNGQLAVKALRRINEAEVAYRDTYNMGYSPTLSALGPPPDGRPSSSAAGLIDSVLASGRTQRGYVLVYTPGAPEAEGMVHSYSIYANPLKFGATGQAYYFTDQSETVRQNTRNPASASDSPVGG